LHSYIIHGPNLGRLTPFPRPALML
jgi:hypothetical protein